MSESETSTNGRRDFLRACWPRLCSPPPFSGHGAGGTVQRDVFVKHAYQEHTISRRSCDELRGLGPGDRPALLLIPGQTESWWGRRRPSRFWTRSSRSSPWISRPGAQHVDAAPLHWTTWATTSCASSPWRSNGRSSPVDVRPAACYRRGCRPLPCPDRSVAPTTKIHRSFLGIQPALRAVHSPDHRERVVSGVFEISGRSVEHRRLEGLVASRAAGQRSNSRLQPRRTDREPFIGRS